MENAKFYWILAAFTIVSMVSLEVACYPSPYAFEGVNNGPYPAASAAQQPNPDGNIKDLQLSQNAFDNRMRLYLLSWLQNAGYPMDRLKPQKRTCLINAGLSHACDYKDTLDAIHEGLYLGSDQTPGRK